MKKSNHDNDRLPMPSFLLIIASLRPTPVPPIVAIVAIGIGDDYECSVATSEAVYMPNANGSS